MGMENKKIVAPAGVDVKSFMEGGLRIPEGYKGVIEDGVFRLVKQESEDERIRKELIEKVGCIIPEEGEYNDDGFILPAYYKRIERYRAYLEKQKEQKPVKLNDDTEVGLDRALQIVKAAKGNLYGYQSDDGIYECDHAIQTLERILKNGIEQKPADLEVESERFLKILSETPYNNTPITNAQVVVKELVTFLRSPEKYDPNHISQQPAEWSEEDKDILDSLIRLYSKEYCGEKWPWSNGNFTFGDVVNFLKSLRPQPKPEWSEEDETMWSNLIGYLEGKVGMLPSGKERYIKWLNERFVKLVYPKSGWKPSDEQIRPLGYAIDYFKKKKNDTTYLESLYNDLKKL
jgi:hypothetical protein